MVFLEKNSTDLLMFYDTPSTRKIKFGLFLALEPPALICNGILVYYLITDRTLRQNLFYHSIFALLIACFLTNLLEVSRIIHYLNIGIVLPQTTVNCLIWQWCDYLLFGTVNVLIFWVSIERSLLILHSHLYNTAKRRLLFHYLPLIMIIIYLITFYTVAIFIYPCTDNFDFKQPVCGFPCYTTKANISLYDNIVHTWIPLCCGSLVDVNLIIQVVHQRSVALQQRGIQWHRYRKMIIQLLVISSLYLVCQLPFNAVVFIQLFITLPDAIAYLQIIYFFYLFWLLTLLLPFACIGCIPEVMDKVKHLLTRHVRRNTIVVPITTGRHGNGP